MWFNDTNLRRLANDELQWTLKNVDNLIEEGGGEVLVLRDREK